MELLDLPRFLGSQLFLVEVERDQGEINKINASSDPITN